MRQYFLAIEITPHKAIRASVMWEECLNPYQGNSCVILAPGHYQLRIPYDSKSSAEEEMSRVFKLPRNVV
jgi:hypothetical protein